jgi:mono/diheme cytochrome c family protein
MRLEGDAMRTPVRCTRHGVLRRRPSPGGLLASRLERRSRGLRVTYAPHAREVIRLNAARGAAFRPGTPRVDWRQGNRRLAMTLWKRVGVGVGLLLMVVLLSGTGFVAYQVHAYDRSMANTYALPVQPVVRSTDAAVLARGQHLAESIGGCIDCHGADLGGKLVADMGPVGTLHAPNISPGGVSAQYGDGELLRLLRDGIKRDGTSVVFMPTGDVRWWPEADFAAVVSWLRVQPAVGRPSVPSHIGPLGKVLDRLDMVAIDVARRIDHHRPIEPAPQPEATARYGQFIARSCQACHGDSLSGGPIPGAPPDMPVPTNLTPHATGLGPWSEADFEKVLNEGVRPDGRKLDPFMPLATLRAMEPVEKKALWLYLRSLPPRPFGER